MLVELVVNKKIHKIDVEPQEFLLDSLRRLGYLSVKRGCETSSCGLCNVIVDEKPVLSCSMLTVRCNNTMITTIEGIQEEVLILGEYLAKEGADQCGFCSPGLLMTVIAMKKELKNPTIEEIEKYLNSTLCRCTGYKGQLRGIEKYLKEVTC
ncbi:MAG: (2Fe-2S)-binding protein [Cetobacterium sp.]